LPSPAVTSRPPGAKLSFRASPLRRLSLSRCVILATRTVATGGFGKVIPASTRVPEVPALCGLPSGT
jgi:hypothetical protein